MSSSGSVPEQSLWSQVPPHAVSAIALTSQPPPWIDEMMATTSGPARGKSPPHPPTSPVATSAAEEKLDSEARAYVLEDLRLSTLQRKLLRESKPAVALALAEKIRGTIGLVENRAYVRRSVDILCDAIVDVFYGKFGDDVKVESTRALASVGQVLAEQQDFNKFHSWLWGAFAKTKRESVQAWLLRGLAELVRQRPLHLADNDLFRIATDVQGQLEKTESAGILMGAVETLREISGWKPKMFEPCFQDVVDILVGWHIDSSQTPQLRHYMSDSLLSWHGFWVLDMEFSSSLLRQFIEDLIAFSEDVSEASTLSQTEEHCQRVLALVQVFNTVLSCLKSPHSTISFLPPESSKWCQIILDCIVTTLEKRPDEDILIAGQQAVLMLMERIDGLFQKYRPKIIEYIKLSLSSLTELSFEGRTSTVKYFTRTYQLVDAQNQQVLINILLNKEDSKILAAAITCLNSRVVDSAVVMFRLLLNSKNILVLQEVYSYLTALYEETLKELTGNPRLINPQGNRFENAIPQRQLYAILLFVLSSLSNVATAKGSVLCLWALNPSLFSLLCNHSGLTKEYFFVTHPWAHHAIIKLLRVHCSTHGFFISSSSIVLDGNSNRSSPSAEHFGQIMSLLATLIKERTLSTATIHLVLDWAKEMIEAIPTATEVKLRKKPEYCNVIKNIIEFFLVTNQREMGKKSTEILEIVIDKCEPEIDDAILVSEVHYTLMHGLRSSWPEVRETCAELLKRLPPPLLNWKEGEKEKTSAKILVRRAKQSVLHTPFKMIHASDFKVFMEAILKGPFSPTYNSKKVARHIEMNQPRDGGNAVAAFESISTHQDLQALWLAQTLAQFCVNNKLKTPMGRAQDTLTSIEKVLRNLAESVEAKPSTAPDRRECQHLLTLFSCLERALSNAFDGSAVTLPPPAKSIAVFFHANKQTCLEWLTRLRLSVIRLAFHVGEHAFVVKNAYHLLERKLTKDQQHDDEFATVVAYLASALVRLNCREELGGLYVWCKENADRRFYWLRSTEEMTGVSVERGLSSLQKALVADAGSSKGLPPPARAVIANELFLGHLSVQCHQEYEAFMAKHREKFPISQATLKEDFLRALSQFSDGTIAPELDGQDHEVRYASLSFDDLLLSSHLLLLKVAACFQGNVSRLPTWAEGEKLTKGLKDLAENVHTLQREVTNSTAAQQVAILTAIYEELSNVVRNKTGQLDTLLQISTTVQSSQNLLLVKKWGEFFVRYHKRDARTHFRISTLNLDIARRARKEGNLSVSIVHLQKALFGGGADSNNSLVESLNSMKFSSQPLSVDRAACLRQCAKLCMLTDAKECAVATLCGVVNSVGTHFMLYQEESHSELLDLSSRSLLNLSSWLGRDPTLLEKIYPETAATDGLSNVLQLEQNTLGSLDFLPMAESASELELVVGRLLRLSVLQSPLLEKCWHAFAEWSLQLGEKILAGYEKSGGIELTAQEKSEAVNILADLSREQVDEVLTVLRRCRLGDSVSAKIDASREEFMREELLECDSLRDTTEDTLQMVNQLWAQVQKRAYFFHETAVSSFFHYVTLSSGRNQDKLISSTLSLLKMTVKLALELQESLQVGLATTPSGKWQAIIPQLFSRLNHPVQVVRGRISDLICRIAGDYPHLIVFPAVVGAGDVTNSTGNVSKLLTSLVHGDDEDDDEKQVETEDEETFETIDHDDETMMGAYCKIVDCMRKLDAAGVDQVRGFVGELQRISLLWDELWLGTLQQYNNDVQKRIRRMEEEARRLRRNETLSSEEKRLLVLDKYNIIFRPLLYVLDKIHAVTSKEPETPHEMAFVRKYGTFIRNMMARLHNPVNPGEPKESWSLLNQLQANLGGKLLSQVSLQFADISPRLQVMDKTRVPMPGIPDKPELTLNAIENNLTILLTKTKPKRIAFMGSDGKRYTYLFKGLEDLHLDERIMQFLKISNIMLRRQDDRLRARFYSVTPLGPRSGLIQWVGGAFPMFSLFKKWQQRQQLPLSDKSADQRNTIAAAVAFQKPSERFYNKVYPLLRQEGVAHLENRKTWPLATLKQALRELQGETPKNIFSQEVWLSSVDAQDWLSLRRSLTVSFSVMSVIGYVLGLGDRHMDNLLLDLARGEVIHIDYNVCFEKGRHLRIPEQVPCRLTQNVVALFGLTGVEGHFRSACEATLQSLRSGKETLMTLLEAFVYDPLVDWTPGVDMGVAGAFHGGRQNDLGVDIQDKREMQTEITFSMFVVRVAEMKGAWMDNKNAVLQVIRKLEERLCDWLDAMSGTDSLNETLSQLHHSMSVLKEAEANPNHRLYSLHTRFIEYNLMENAVKTQLGRVASFLEEHEHWAHVHQRTLSLLFSQSQRQLTKWLGDAAGVSTNTGATSALVRDFLEKAGQAALLEQFEAAESAFCIAIEKQKQAVLACAQLLRHYANVACLYPASYRQRHRNILYARWARRLAESFTVATCQSVGVEFAAEFAEEESTDEERRVKRHRVLTTHFQLDNIAQEINFHLQSLTSRLAKENLEEGSGGALVHLSRAKCELQQCVAQQPEAVRTHVADLLVAGALGQLTTRLTQLEASAAQAGENLVTYCSGTEWFLIDDVHMHLGEVVHVLDALDFLGLSTTDFNEEVQVLRKLLEVVKQLQHFNASFFGIILQEGIKLFQREDTTVIGLAFQLAEIINEAGLSLEELLQELEVEIRYAANDMPSANEASVIVARSVKAKYLALLKSIGEAQECDSLSSGQMLFLAFDTLFNNVDAALADAKLAFGELKPPPTTWQEGIETVFLSARLSSDTTRFEVAELTELVTFMQRLLVLKEFFALCTRSMICFKAESSSAASEGTLPSGEAMAQPVKYYLAEFYRRQMLGLPSQAAVLLVCRFMEHKEPSLLTNLTEENSQTRLQLEELTKTFLTQQTLQPSGGSDRGRFFTLEVANLQQLIHRVEVARHLEQNLEALQSSQQINQIQRNSFQWFHESLLPFEPMSLVAPIRPSLLSDLRAFLSSLLMVSEEVTAAQSKYQEFYSTVEMRLKWASGANPDMQEVLDAYSASFVVETQSLRTCSGVAKAVSGAANAVLHHEALRTHTSEALAADSAFSALLGDCQQSAALKEAQQLQGLSEQERHIFTLCPPGDVIDKAWIRNTEEAIAVCVRDARERLRAAHEKSQEAVYLIQDSSKELVLTITEHQKLMADAGALLRTVSKSEDYHIPEVSAYLQRYKSFSDVVSAVVRDTRQDEQREDSIRQLASAADSIKEVLPAVYDDLVTFSTLFREDSLESYKVKQPGRGSGVKGSAEQAAEEKNAFALNVLRRVRLKLDGREPDALKRATATEQVDFIIREATSIDNLALMYEGWTAWI